MTFSALSSSGLGLLQTQPGSTHSTSQPSIYAAQINCNTNVLLNLKHVQFLLGKNMTFIFCAFKDSTVFFPLFLKPLTLMFKSNLLLYSLNLSDSSASVCVPFIPTVCLPHLNAKLREQLCVGSLLSRPESTYAHTPFLSVTGPCAQIVLILTVLHTFLYTHQRQRRFDEDTHTHMFDSPSLSLFQLERSQCFCL